MTPEELGRLHPRLYHLTDAGAWANICRHGLLTSEEIMRLCHVPEPRQTELLTSRRSKAITLTHLKHGAFILGDNGPLSERKLAKCLDDGLTAPQWIGMLNARIFFWSREADAEKLRASLLKRNAAKRLIVLDTVSLVSAYFDRAEVAPINTGATVHNPARRGLSTFAKLAGLEYPTWRRSRGNKTPDRIKEVTIRGGIQDIEAHVIDE